MRPDDGNTTFYPVHIFTALRLHATRILRVQFLHYGFLGDLRDGVQKGVHSSGIIFHGVFVGPFPWSCNLVLLWTGLMVSVLFAMLTFVGGLT